MGIFLNIDFTVNSVKWFDWITEATKNTEYTYVCQNDKTSNCRTVKNEKNWIMVI